MGGNTYGLTGSVNRIARERAQAALDQGKSAHAARQQLLDYLNSLTQTFPGLLDFEAISARIALDVYAI